MYLLIYLCATFPATLSGALVWCADITYLPMRKGFIYLVAIMDQFTRKVLAFAHLEHAEGRVLPRGPERGQPIPFTGSGQRYDKDCVFCRHPHRSNCRRIGQGNRRITWSRQG